MLTAMTDEDWTIVLRVFAASRSRRGDKGRNDRKFLEALQLFCCSQYHLAGSSGEIRALEQRVEAVLAAKPIRHLRSVFRCPGGDERDGASGADVRFHRGARPCLGGGRKRMARPVGKWFCDAGMNSLHKRIRPFGYAVGQDGDPRVPVLIKGTASRCHFAP